MSETLVLVHRIPFPPDRGDKIRSWHMVREIARHGRVHLACFADDAKDAAHIDGLRAALGDALGEVHVEIRRPNRGIAALKAFATGRPLLRTLFDSASMRRFVVRRLADPKVTAIFAFSVQMAQFVPELAHQRFVMDLVDVDSAKYAAYGAAGGQLGWLFRREAKALLAYEAETARRADAGLFVSEAEAGLFRAQTNVTTVRGMSNGIDATAFDPAAVTPVARDARPMLIFTGQMDYRPNVEAVRWFAAEVMPKLGDIHFVIAGRAPTADVMALASDRITVTGAVDDMRAWLAAADLVVAPLQIARGIQNKVLEAMAMGRPVIASPGAFEGIEAEPGRDICIADDADEWVAAITALLAAPAEAAKMGQSARRLIVDTYSWDQRLAPLAGLLGLERTS